MVKGWTIVLFALFAPCAYAADITAPGAVKPSGTAALIAGGAGDQVYPRISGKLVAYMSQPEGRIHYVNLNDNSDNTIPGPDGSWDALPGVSGNTIVFRRATLDWQAICAFDITTKATRTLNPPVEGQWTYQLYPSIGGHTVAWQERFSAAEYDDVVVFDLGTNVITRLTNGNDGYNRVPFVSADGGTIVWTKQTDLSVNQLWQATRNPDGTWTTKQLPTADFVFSQPATNGEIVVYETQNDVDLRQTDIHIQPVGGGAETRILIPASKSPCRVSGHLIVFTSWTGNDYEDTYAYDIETNTLYRITDTPLQSERWVDVSVDADGTARVAWSADNGDNGTDVYALAFHLGQTYTVRPLFDQQRSYKFGGVAPIKLQLLDADGNNVSSAELVVSATGVVPVGSNTPSEVVDAGNANPDANFRYDATLGGYIFNLTTKNLAPGTWELQFRIGSDSAPYAVRFSLR